LIGAGLLDMLRAFGPEMDASFSSPTTISIA
jgi:hypothetical protein